jgi:hypothetical protein
MRGSEITKEQGRLEQSVRELTDIFITSGRGHETPKDRQGKTDPLSLLDRKVTDRQSALLNEITQRAGPGYYTLPRGVGAKPRLAPEWTPAKDVSDPTIAERIRIHEVEARAVRENRAAFREQYKDNPDMLRKQQNSMAQAARIRRNGGV